jgi:hypothetical protein
VVIVLAIYWTQGSRVQTRPRAMDFGAIKIRSPTFFGGELQPSVPCRKISRHVKDLLRYDMY